MQQELTASQKETKQSSSMLAELKVSNANLENQVANLRRDVEESRQEAKRALQAVPDNFAGGNASPATDGGLEDQYPSSGDRVPLAEAQEEIRRIQTHYENEIVIAKKERVELVSKVQELMAANERIKLESNK